jgi:hypothetical protein
MLKPYDLCNRGAKRSLLLGKAGKVYSALLEE